MKYVGIDPGIQGAICVLDEKENLIEYYLNPSGLLLHRILKDVQPRAVFIEKAQTMPKQGIVSAFNYGSGFGELIAAVNIAEIRYYLVSPRRWTSKMLIGTAQHDSTKYRAATAFKRLWPDWAEDKSITNRAGRLHEGVVDAALIGLYGIKNL